MTTVARNVAHIRDAVAEANALSEWLTLQARVSLEQLQEARTEAQEFVDRYDSKRFVMKGQYEDIQVGRRITEAVDTFKTTWGRKT